MRADYFNSILGKFQDRLKEFETIIDSAPKEQALQDFIKNNPWILDFKFFQYPEPEVQKEMDIKGSKKGRADLIFSKKQFNTEHITIVEFKKVDVNTTGFTRSDQNLSTIMSPVVKGLSQLIHYIENTKNPYAKVDGILVIGKRNEESDYFIDTFQQYLQKIEIVTYDRLLEKTSEIVKGLESKKSPTTQNAITTSQDQTLS